MADDALVGYNSDDPYQTGFLNALALGETGGAQGSAMMGVGGSNLSGDPTDQYGFPVWEGEGNSHAAGTYQFQPGTWDTIAGQLGLTSFSPSNQDEAAWTLAEQTYYQQTGQSLESALQAGNYSSVQSALKNVWPSVTGNQANPTGLSSVLSNYISGSNTAIAANDQAGSTTSPSTSDLTSPGSGTAVEGADPNGFSAKIAGAGGGILSSVIGGTENLFERGGLLLIGAIVIIAALWALLADRGYVPSPKKLVRAL
jgi:muramidase (phage lysozyme)